MLVSFIAAVTAAIPPLALIALKTTLLVAAAFALTFALRRRSAATRHLIWSATFASALLLPLAVAAVPQWRVLPRALVRAFQPSSSRLPAVAPRGARSARAGQPVVSVTTSTDVVVVPRVDVRHDRAHAMAIGRGNAFAITTSAGGATTVAIAGRGVGRATSGSHLGVGRAAPAASPARFTNAVMQLASLPVLLVVVWLLGALFFLVDVVGGARMLARVRSRATPVWGGRWDRCLAIARGDCTRSVLLLVSDEVDVPATWGITQPVIILPSHARAWADDRLVLVLQHEMAHVGRWDVLAQLVARVVTSLNWPNPLVWLAERAMRRECEIACDDAVVAGGTRPSRYAEELLDIAGDIGGPPLGALATPFATRSTLESRLRALLDATSARRRATALDGATAVMVGALVLLPVAMMSPRHASASTRSFGGAAVVATGGFGGSAPVTVMVAREAGRPAMAVPTPAAPVGGVPVPPGVTVPTVAPGIVPVAPPAAACDPSRKGSSSNRTISNNGKRSWEVHWSGDDCAIDLRSDGTITFSDDFTDIAGVSDGGWFDLTERTGDDQRRLVVRSRNGALERRYTVNGETRPWDAAAQAWLAGILVSLDRTTGFAAATRVPQLLARGGVTAVLDEVEKMPSDYAASTYLKMLIDARRLDAGDQARVIRRTESLDSDYERSGVLVALVSKYGLPDDATRRAFGSAIGRSHSDYERNRALHALIDRKQTSPADAAVIVDALRGMSSDYEQARTLVRLAKETTSTSGLVTPYLAAASHIGSDYERARSLIALASAAKFTPEERAAYRAAARAIGSDYERTRALAALVSAEER